ncbi:hypothetical protein ISCGN_000752 [Ixodes scapularis]
MAGSRVFTLLRVCCIFATILRLRMDNTSLRDCWNDFDPLRVNSAASSAYIRFPPSFSVWSAVGPTSARPSSATTTEQRFSQSRRPGRPPFPAGILGQRLRHRLVCCLLLAGDIASNPGPPHPSCASCATRVRDNQAAVCCDSCEGWFHRGCLHMSLSQYRKLGTSSDPWFCLVCSLPPFSDDLFDSAPDPPSPIAPGAPDVSLLSRSAGINKGTTFWYNNCRSVKNKIVDLQALACSLPACSVILLSETWLDDSVADSELLPLDTYSVLRRDRGSRGGGVLMAVPSCLRFNRRRDLEHTDLEALFVEFFFPRGTVLVCCVYCPPATRQEAYRFLDSSLESVAADRYANILVFGDFNAHVDWCTFDDPVPRDTSDDILLETMTTAGLIQACRQPTYVTRDGLQSHLDLVFTFDVTRIESVDVSEGLHGSDHSAIELR